VRVSNGEAREPHCRGYRLWRGGCYDRRDRMTRSDATRPKPEDLDDEAWSALLERVEQGAMRRHLAERDRLIGAGIIDGQGRLLRQSHQAERSDDGGGW